jgi:hypothetical protein
MRQIVTIENATAVGDQPQRVEYFLLSLAFTLRGDSARRPGGLPRERSPVQQATLGTGRAASACRPPNQGAELLDRVRGYPSVNHGVTVGTERSQVDSRIHLSRTIG